MAKFNGTVDNIEDNRNKVTNIDTNSTDTQYPSAKAVKTYVDAHSGGGGGAYLPLDGSDAMTGDLDMGTKSVRNANTVVAQTFARQLPIGTGPLEPYPAPSAIITGTKVTSIDSSSTNNQVPSAKCVYDAIQAALYVDTSTVIIPAEV